MPLWPNSNEVTIVPHVPANAIARKHLIIAVGAPRLRLRLPPALAGTVVAQIPGERVSSGPPVASKAGAGAGPPARLSLL